MSRDVVIELLRRHPEILPETWLKPFDSFVEPGARIYEEGGVVVRETRSAWVNVTHVALDGGVEGMEFRLDEDRVVYPGGQIVHRNRNPDRTSPLRGMSETEQEGDKDAADTALRLLREEAKFLKPSRTRLIPHRIALSRSLAQKPLIVDEDSGVFFGVRSRKIVVPFDYHADATEFDHAFDGKVIVSTDEHQVKTYLVWREVHD